MTVQESAAQLAEGLEIVVALAQRSADEIQDVPRHSVIWAYSNFLRQWHLAAPRLDVDEGGSEALASILDAIVEAEQALVASREPWIYLRRRKNFRASAIRLLQAHGIALHDLLMKARALADGDAA